MVGTSKVLQPCTGDKDTMHWRYRSLEVEALERKVGESGRERKLIEGGDGVLS